MRAEAWPASIVPAAALRRGLSSGALPPDGGSPPEDASAALEALGEREALRLLLALFEGPLDAAGVARATGLGPTEAREVADALVAAGLATTRDGRYAAAARHFRAEGAPPEAQVAFRATVLALAQAAVDDGRRTLAEWGAEARAGLGVVTLPDAPDVLAEAVRILAETEDRLRALAARHADGEAVPRLRVTTLVASTDERFV